MPTILIGLFWNCLSYKIYLYILDTSPLLGVWFGNITFWFVAGLFILLISGVFIFLMGGILVPAITSARSRNLG